MQQLIGMWGKLTVSEYLMEAQVKTKVVDVAVGVIMRGDQVLISWRHASQHQGNRYEFPGGKIDPHETAAQGLARELKEELGIDIKQVIQAQQLEFAYPEKTVRLHIFKVTAFEGEPTGQEGQPVRWVQRHELHNYQFPDANAPILRMVQLPDHYVICREQSVQEPLRDWMDFHVQAVPPSAWLYVRHAALTCEAYVSVVQQLALQRPDLRLMVMAKHAMMFMENSATIQGVHFSRQDLMQLGHMQDYPSVWFKFAACHDEGSIQKANQLKLDAITLSPLHATRTHPHVAALGWENWQALALHSQVPVYALGGVQLSDLSLVQQHAGFGIAGIRAFMAESNAQA